jgi:hypothetical protein
MAAKLASQIQSIVASQTGEWTILDIQKHIPIASLYRIGHVIGFLRRKETVRRVSMKRTDRGCVAVYVTNGREDDEAPERPEKSELLFAKLMGDRRFEDVKTKIVGKFHPFQTLP